MPFHTSHPDLVDPQKVIKERCNPLSYWQHNERSKPSVLITTFAGSIASERLFSTAADIADGKCNRLLSTKVEMLLIYCYSILSINEFCNFHISKYVHGVSAYLPIFYAISYTFAYII